MRSAAASADHGQQARHCLNDSTIATRSARCRWTRSRSCLTTATPTVSPPLRRAVHHLPVAPQNKPAQDGEALGADRETVAELIVLAVTCRSWSDASADSLTGRAIKSPGSCLRSGRTALSPAYERGVKLIRCYSALRDASTRRGPDHRAGGRARRVQHACGGPRHPRPGRGMHRPRPRRQVPPRATGVSRRCENNRVQVGKRQAPGCTISSSHARGTPRPDRASIAAMGPLAGLRVLELEAIGPGPFCGMMLADMGPTCCSSTGRPIRGWAWVASAGTTSCCEPGVRYARLKSDGEGWARSRSSSARMR